MFIGNSLRLVNYQGLTLRQFKVLLLSVTFPCDLLFIYRCVSGVQSTAARGSITAPVEPVCQTDCFRSRPVGLRLL